MTPEQTVSTAEVAHRTGVHPRTVRRWIAEGTITGYRIGPRLLRVSAAEVDDLLTTVAK